jgi:glycosyltransferase involved in cell wall biosynthesis
MIAVDINGRFFTQTITGVQRYARELVRALDRRLQSEPALRSRYTFRLVTPPHTSPDISLEHISTVSRGRLRGHAWEQLELPRGAGGRLLLNLCNTAPIWGRTIVTIHDASVFAVPEAYSRAFGTWYRFLLPRLGHRALSIATDSAFSRSELQRYLSIAADRITTIHLGAEHILAEPADTRILERLALPRRYLLAVSSNSPHKNFGGILAAVAQLADRDYELVFAGGGRPRVFRQSGELGNGAYLAGEVTDAELRALYEHAECFVYPSFYEGFGLPPIEAMTCGCPVIASRAASLPEVCGEAAVYCDPEDPADIARAIQRVMTDSALRTDLRQSGRERAACFTWSRAAQSMLDLIDTTVTQ